MLRRIPIKKYIVGGILPLNSVFSDNPDKVSHDPQTEAFVDQSRVGQTGRDRLYMMFTSDEFGNISPEMHSVLQGSFLGMFIGAVYGGFVRSRAAYLEFMERNQATVFKTHLEAKKKLQDQVTISFGKGAFQWGWRLAFFTGSYVLISTSIAVYRGKSSVWEYIAAGGFTGACYKLSLGPRGMLVGGLLGCCLGTFAGGITMGILALSGSSMDEVRFWQYRWKEARLKQTSKLIKDYKAKDEPSLIMHHDERFKSENSLLSATDSDNESKTEL